MGVFDVLPAGAGEQLAALRPAGRRPISRARKHSLEQGTAKAAGMRRLIDVEAVVAAEECEGRLVIADFDGEGVTIGTGHVRRTTDDEFKPAPRRREGEGIGLKKADPIGDAIRRAAFWRAIDTQRGFGKIDRGDGCVRRACARVQLRLRQADADVSDAR